MNLLLDTIDLLNSIKKASTEAVEAGKPTQICYGKVTNLFPLQVQVEQKLLLGKEQLLLARNVCDYSISLTLDWHTESAIVENVEHQHSVVGTKEITVHNSLSIGEEVLLVRVQGGQKYVIMDRVVS